MADPAIAEHQTRCARLQQHMAQDGLGALLLTGPADIFYLTGFLTRFWESPARPWFLLVPSSGDPIAVIPVIGEALMQRSWISDIRTWPAPDPRDDGLSLLTGTIAEILPQGMPLGLPMGLETHLRMPLADFARLQERFAMADATNALQRVREIKSEAEINAIRTTCQIAARAFAQVPRLAAGGAPLDQVFRQFQATLLQEGADWVSYLAGAAGPGGYGDVISPAQATPLQAGDVLMLDTGAVKDGYFCDFDRNFAVGAPPDATLRAHEALWDATEDALGALRPGMRAAEAHALLAGGLIRRGHSPLRGRLGHGLGITLTEWPSFTPLDQTALRAGMVLTLEPGIDLGGGRILVHEENIALRPDGAELLSPRASREMPRVAP